MVLLCFTVSMSCYKACFLCHALILFELFGPSPFSSFPLCCELQLSGFEPEICFTLYASEIKLNIRDIGTQRLIRTKETNIRSYIFRILIFMITKRIFVLSRLYILRDLDYFIKEFKPTKPYTFRVKYNCTLNNFGTYS